MRIRFACSDDVEDADALWSLVEAVHVDAAAVLLGNTPFNTARSIDHGRRELQGFADVNRRFVGVDADQSTARTRVLPRHQADREDG